MIGGVYPSQMHEVEVIKSSHYRNLKNLVNKGGQRKVHVVPDILKISRHRKFNHDNWKIYTHNQQEKTRFERNSNILNRLSRISQMKSRYTPYKTEQSATPRDCLLHHNYLYECRRRYQKTLISNQFIAEKIVNASTSLSHKKQQQEFKLKKMNVSRLEKFSQYKRMEKFAERSFYKRLHTASDRFSSIPVGNNPEL